MGSAAACPFSASEERRVTREVRVARGAERERIKRPVRVVRPARDSSFEKGQVKPRLITSLRSDSRVKS